MDLFLSIHKVWLQMKTLKYHTDRAENECSCLSQLHRKFWSDRRSVYGFKHNDVILTFAYVFFVTDNEKVFIIQKLQFVGRIALEWLLHWLIRQSTFGSE